MTTITLCKDIATDQLQSLLNNYQLSIVPIASDTDIPGSFWGDEEAGLIDNQLYIRNDTPLHSLLHEACHYICMSPQRRQNIHTNAGGDYDEENAVCYLQILLSDHIPNFNREKMFNDMDKWGYSFRLGSAKRWFQEDAEDALQWLIKYQLITNQQHPNWQLRDRL